MSEMLECPNCRAQLHPARRGAKQLCEFCGAEVLLDPATVARLAASPPSAPTGLSMEAIADRLGEHRGDGAAFLAELAPRLAELLPGRVTVEMKGGLLSKAHPVKVDVDLGEYRYHLALDGHRLSARRAHVVRGIALKSSELELPELLDALAAELYEASRKGDEARQALARFLK
jgi:hypothetical protein